MIKRQANEEQQISNELIMLQQQDTSSIKCYKQTIPVNIYHFYISDHIEDYKTFLDFINILKTAEEHDRIVIYLNCPGGDLYITIQIINAIRLSRATVVTCMDGQVCSAATLIFLSGHEYIVNKHCSFMIHNYSEGVFGKGNEIISRVKHATDWFKKLTYEIYGGFLTDVEIEGMLEGKDIWLDSDEVLRRLEQNNQPVISDMEELVDPEPELEPIIQKKKPAAKKKPAKKS
jgi:ATP-dependent protease ClpP protease subunit